jgi:hypothetical protein
MDRSVASVSVPFLASFLLGEKKHGRGGLSALPAKVPMAGIEVGGGMGVPVKTRSW